MTPAVCQPPHSHLRAPRVPAPPGSCDSHLHIIGPADRFPLSPNRSYTPSEASIADYRRVQAVLGTERLVIVQASVYGTDNACMLDALATFGANARGVVVIDSSVSEAELGRMHELGVRGVRFNMVTLGGPPLQQMIDVAARIAPLGWHVQLYADGERLAALLPALLRLPVDIVIDHLGGIKPDWPIDHPARRAVRTLLAGGRAWIKLCAYRSSTLNYPFDDIGATIVELVDAFPDRCVWGTDWPHPKFERAMPHDGELLDALMQWAPTEASQRAILVDNPARLYGYDR